MSLTMLALKNNYDPGPPPEPIYGDPLGGGYYVGDIMVQGVRYKVICAPKSAQVSGLAWQNPITDIQGLTRNDGLFNRTKLTGTGFPAANYCNNYTGGGFTDWYLPGPDELELAYRNLKPTATPNSLAPRTGGAGGGSNGQNSNSVPVGAGYTANNPVQTSVALFRTGGSEAFDTGYYHTSMQDIGNTVSAMNQVFGDGTQTTSVKNQTSLITRPFRRIPAS